MIRSIPLFSLALVLASLFSGCGANYPWKSSVPAEMRTVAVPTFRNESDVQELGAIATRQVLRELQREGTFKIRTPDEAALEIQGVVKSASCGMSAYDRRTRGRIAAYDCSATVEVSVIDKRNRKVLIDNRKYRAEASVTSGQDVTTSMRDASGRLADDLARQVVNDVLNLKW